MKFKQFCDKINEGSSVYPDIHDWHVALFEFLKEHRPSAVSDISDIEEQQYEHYSLKTFEIESISEEYAIGTDYYARESAKDSVRDLIDDIGVSNPENYLDGEAVADYFMDGEEEYLREEPSVWNIDRVMIDGDDSNKLEAYKEILEESEENFNELEEKVSDMEEKLSDIEDRYADETNSDKIDRLDTKIEKLNNVIDRLNDQKDIEDEQIDMTTDIIDKMEDKDNDDYWEWDELQIEEMVSDKRDEIENDPAGFLDNYGYLDTDNSDNRDLLESFMDMDQYIDDTVNEDRGSILSGYDGDEIEFVWNKETYYIYRIN